MNFFSILGKNRVEIISFFDYVTRNEEKLTLFQYEMKL